MNERGSYILLSLTVPPPSTKLFSVPPGAQPRIVKLPPNCALVQKLPRAQVTGAVLQFSKWICRNKIHSYDMLERLQ